jgi:hypothetical protein
VTGRRDDGYHDLESLTVFADCGDRLRFARADGLELALEGPFAPALAAEADNLVLRAAALLAEGFTFAAQDNRCVQLPGYPVNSQFAPYFELCWLSSHCIWGKPRDIATVLGFGIGGGFHKIFIEMFLHQFSPELKILYQKYACKFTAAGQYGIYPAVCSIDVFQRGGSVKMDCAI